TSNSAAHCLQTPCILQGEKVIAFVDSGATTSFVSRKFVTDNKLVIQPVTGQIQQFLSGSTVPRFGMVHQIALENGTRRIKCNLEVADMSGPEPLVIGIDLF